VSKFTAASRGFPCDITACSYDQRPPPPLQLIFHRVILAKYVAAINMDDFDADEQPNVFAAKEYRVLKSLFCRLLCVPATCAPVERVFSQGGLIMRPNHARMGRCPAWNADAPHSLTCVVLATEWL